MQNKGAVTVLAIALGLISLYQLSFTFATYKVRRDAKEYAKGDLVKQRTYVDSIAALPKEKWSYLGYTFKDVQKKQMNLGLDLKGGMNVILEVSVEDVLKSLSNYSTDKTFLQAIAKAKGYERQSQADFLTLFGRAFQEIDPNAKLASIFGTPALRDKINFNSTNEEVMKVLNEEVNTAIDNSFNILRTRIDRFGVVQPNITKLSTKGRILIELPGQEDPKRVRELLQGTANLEFWETYENSEVINYLIQANNILREIQKSNAKTDTTKSAVAAPSQAKPAAPADTTKKDQALEELISKDTTKAKAETRQEFDLQNPLFAVLNPRVDQKGQPLQSSMVGLVRGMDTAKVNSYLKMPRIKILLPRDLRFVWSLTPYKYDPTKSMFELHAIKITTRDGRAPLGGDVITGARPTSGRTGSEVQVDFTMNSEGAKTWARMTRENIGRCIAVVLDGYVRSYPRVINEITGGSTEVTGDFTLDEATDLANILKSGKMPAPARIVSDNVIGPSLGKEAINSGFVSFVIAFILVLSFMIFYYSRSAGTIADIALFVNLLLLFGVLASLNAVLSLPGIAGIVLTMGMDVDANILIFERTREELRNGKGVKLALYDGYRRAYPAIIDSKATTIITGVVLYVFGSGPIKSFATTLIIGTMTSLFASIFITRLIYEALLKRNKQLHFSIKMTAEFLKHTNIDFIGMRKYFYIASAIILTSGIISLFTRGLNPGIDFKGGRTFVVRFDEPVTTENIANKLTVAFGELPQVVTYGNVNQVKITTAYRINETGAEDAVDTKLYEGLQSFFPPDVSRDNFLRNYMKSSETVGPVVAADIKINAFYAVGIALVLIFFYIFVRYKYWQFGFGAVASLFHDVLLVLGVYSLLWGHMPFSMEIDQSFIAAILTVIGYSVSDTVIVFDRVREFLPLYRKRPFKEVLNIALNATLSRTINTTFAVILTIAAMFIFGGAVIRGFMFALLVGISTGVYSSVFVATALMYDTSRGRHKELESKILSKAVVNATA
ncbi:MAG: protein translocase subunit SecDF [Bacteroidota bacterium]|nr:protein translocase subunit SecDF [Bacteroidota bacterium]